MALEKRGMEKEREKTISCRAINGLLAKVRERVKKEKGKNQLTSLCGIRRKIRREKKDMQRKAAKSNRELRIEDTRISWLGERHRTLMIIRKSSRREDKGGSWKRAITEERKFKGCLQGEKSATAEESKEVVFSRIKPY